jgi:hypothetical protein
LKFYAKRRSLIFVLVPSLALEVACEVLAPSLILVERALLWLKTPVDLPKLACCFPGQNLLVVFPVPPPSQKLANLLTEVKLTKYWSSTHCRKIQELNPLLV